MDRVELAPPSKPLLGKSIVSRNLRLLRTIDISVLTVAKYRGVRDDF